MQEEPAPAKLRLRLLAWLGAVLILAPVLYVAAVGPLRWWQNYHPRDLHRFDDYSRSLLPLYAHPDTAKAMIAYTSWWRSVPVPRSWRRAVWVNRLKDLNAQLEQVRAEQKKREAKDAQLNAQLEELRQFIETTATDPAKAEKLPLERETIQNRMEDPAASNQIMFHFTLETLEKELQQAEQNLKEIDAH